MYWKTKIALTFFAGILVSQTPLPALSSDVLHTSCLEARDYEGCIEAWSGIRQEATLEPFPIDGDKGKKLKSFDTLRSGSDCKVSFYENALDICGTTIGRKSIEKWEQLNLQGCNSVGTWCIGEIHFDVLYLSSQGLYGDRFTFLNRNAARSLSEMLTQWSGRIQG